MKKRLNLSASGAADTRSWRALSRLSRQFVAANELAVQQGRRLRHEKEDPERFPRNGSDRRANVARIPFLATEEAKPRPSRLRKFIIN